MAKQESKGNPYLDIEEKVKKLIAGIAEQMPKLSPNDMAVLQRAIKVLARNTRAGAERLAILHLLGTHEAVPGTVLYQLCSQRVEKRVRELRSIGMDIRGGLRRGLMATRIQSTAGALSGCGNSTGC